MQRRDAYPVDTATGSCFLTGDYDPSEGIVDLDLYLDVLPPFGRLCVSAKAVRMMVQVLGFEWPTDEYSAQLDIVLEEQARLRDENLKLRKALTSIVNASKLAALDDWMVRS